MRMTSFFINTAHHRDTETQGTAEADPACRQTVTVQMLDRRQEYGELKYPWVWFSLCLCVSVVKGFGS
jgi:hypothetical protein